MKKQFLLLAFFSLAILAGTNTAWGQMRPSTLQPTPLDPTICTPSPLNPMPGLPFTYKVGNTNMVGSVNYTWWATKNPNFIDNVVHAPATVPTFLSDTTDMLRVNTNELLDATLTTGTYGGAFESMGDEIEITWSANILAATDYQGTPNIAATPAAPSPTFVVVQADGSCNNNLQVFELNPMPAFTLDIANINPTDTTDVIAFGTPATQCVDIVRAASYSGGVVTMDYGTDTLLFEVVAANYVTNWLPTFEVMGGISGSQTATIGWAYSIKDALAGNFIDGAHDITSAAYASTVALTPQTTANTAEGTSIFVRVVIDNNTFESIAQQDFQLAVDGIDASGQWDINQAGADCAETGADQADIATHEITPRPDITDTTGDGLINTTPDDTFINSPRN